MRLRIILNSLAALLSLLLAPSSVAGAQEHPARRLSNIVGVAVEEYKLALDEQGRLVNEIEYTEAVEFLKDAAGVAERLSGERAATARAVLDSIIAAVDARRPPPEVVALHGRFAEALGAEGALEMPAEPIDLEAGAALFAANCASCHGALGQGDGPLASGLDPAPPPIGNREAMVDVSPATAYRVVSVGIKGTAMPGYAGQLTAEQRWNLVAYIHHLRASDAERLEGEGLFLQQCASCHGPTGGGDGPVSDALTRLPPDLASFAWQAERSDADIAQVVRAGVPGTAMPAAPHLSAAQVGNVVAYLRTLPVTSGVAPALAAQRQAPTGEDAARRVMSLLDQALAAARAGRTDEAGERAFDAYVAFEPLERPARAKSPGAVGTMEAHFADFRGALRAGNVRDAERELTAIEAGMPGILELAQPTAGGWGAFIASFLIILREGVEAILVIGAVITFLIKTGHREKLRAIWWGVGAALAASAVTAVVLQTVLRALPATREIIEGVTMLVAVAVLFSVSYWLISKVEAAKWQQFIKEKVNAALERGGGTALTAVAFLAVYREGAETALFYQALLGEGTTSLGPILLGLIAGFAVLAVIFTLFYRFGVRIPLRPFFAVTSVLLYYMAFVFAGKGIRELQEGNAVPITVIPGLPTIDAVGIYPTVETLGAQLVLVALFAFALLKTFWPRRAVALPTAPPEATAAPPIAAEIAELREQTARLQARIAVIENEIAEGERSRAFE